MSIFSDFKGNIEQEAYVFYEQHTGEVLDRDEAGRIRSQGRNDALDAYRHAYTSGRVTQLAADNQFISEYFGNDNEIGPAGLPVLAHPAGFTHNMIYTKAKREKFIENALHADLLFVPGDRYRYSNIGYGLSAAIIEKITGISWESYIQQHILLPVGVKEMGYRLLERKSQHLAVNYGRDPNVFQRALSIQAASKSVGHSLQHQYDNPGPRWYLEGGGGFLSTVTDMYHWYLALSSGKILNETSWKKMFTPYIAENKKATSYYGYGWSLSKTKNGHRRIEHTGSNGYTYAVFQYFPDDELFIFIATNNWDDYPTKLVESIGAIAFKKIQGGL